MQLSHEAQTLLDICWVDGDPRSTTFIIGEKTNFKGIEFKPNEKRIMNYWNISPALQDHIRLRSLASSLISREGR
ncbi:hypothetical protein G7L40_20765 [Paenibacillus polymyxa]|uniref:Uncharacterized protein n=1 Tax=Paenibacillus polymyxa TaxID=1406 RepID=A0A378Y0D1_PAEPO|nr:hypothetical protein [Paenibacillus polymyxa]MBE7896073.1 hypothetical protein [Paenibacillus polymyxa]MBG9765971.1 hypothetical protein [Paenibacillus polymyxa]MCC3256610.1 hypothetical protein [Paenibacillus polymyxa]QPK54905.1 hypothetical protein G7035_20820 [Paenibacillus polymyxa]QPK59993.1 hypothetical protein G7L40_20765 [Paenibacillus polymyxa]